MGFSETTSGQKTVISVNGFIRLMQVVIGVATIGCYAQEKGYWLDHGLPSKLVKGPRFSFLIFLADQLNLEL